MKKWLALLLSLTLIPAAAMANSATIYKRVEGAVGDEQDAQYTFQIDLEMTKGGDIYVYHGDEHSSSSVSELQLTGDSGSTKEGTIQLKANEYVQILPTNGASAKFSIKELVPHGAMYYPKSTAPVTGSVAADGSSIPDIHHDYYNSYNHQSLAGGKADSNTSPYTGKDQRADAESKLNVRLDGNIIDSKFYTVQWSNGTQLVDELVDAGTYHATITGSRYVQYEDGKEPLSYSGTIAQEVTFTITSTTTPEPDPTAVPTATPTARPSASLPKTGDESQLLLWAALSVSSLLGISLLLRRRKRA